MLLFNVDEVYRIKKNLNHVLYFLNFGFIFFIISAFSASISFLIVPDKSELIVFALKI